MQVNVKRKNTLFFPDPSRIIPQFLETTESKSIKIITSILSMSEAEVSEALNQLLRSFVTRHRNITRVFEKHFIRLIPILTQLKIDEKDLSYFRKALIGSCFTKEYSIESVAFYNPSIIEDPDQSELRPFEKRVILSFRATGEGQTSSIVFRSGILDRNNKFIMEPLGKMLTEPDLCLNESNEVRSSPKEGVHTDRMINDISGNYKINFSIDSDISERVIFPISPTEKKGIEDANFVKFTDDDGRMSYYATYTANDGESITQKIINTTDFYNFNVLQISGEITHSNGMALFPRKINGKYAMLCRIDEENNYISYSEDLNTWQNAKLIQEPKYPWEILQISHAGSPVETEEGWLVITYAVGPMRKCVIGASLFELDNPEKEISRLKNPLIVPTEAEREGFIPNKVFSCGSIIHNETLIIPYSTSEHYSTYATVALKELLNELKGENKSKNHRKSIVGNIERRLDADIDRDMKVA